MTELIGQWMLHESENWDEYLKELGVNYLNRKLLTKLDDLSPIQTISIEENQLFTKTLTSLHKREKQYVIGEYFDEITPDGRQSKSIVRVENSSKIVHEQRDPDTEEIVTVITREVIEDKLVHKFKIGDVICNRVYKRV